MLGTVRDPDRGRRPPEAAGSDLAAQPAVRSLPVAALARRRSPNISAPRSTAPGPARSTGSAAATRYTSASSPASSPATAGSRSRPAELDLPVELRRLVVQRMSQLSPALPRPGRRLRGRGRGDRRVAGAHPGGRRRGLLAEAVAAGVLVDDPLTPASLRFSHDLVRRATTPSWPGPTGSAGTAGSPTRSPGAAGRARSPPTAVRGGGRPGGTAERDRGGLCGGRRRSGPRPRPEPAAAWYGQALDLLDGDPERRAELLLARAEAGVRRRAFASALDDCAAAMDAAPNRPDVGASAAVVVRGYYNDPTVLSSATGPGGARR